MRYFTSKPTKPRPEFLDQGRYWGLSGVKCPICSETWAMVGMIYADIRLDDLPGSEDLSVPRAVSLDEHLRQVELVRPLLPSGAILPPGTRFGPLRLGRGSGPFPDFVWPTQWIVLVRRGVLEILRQAEIKPLVAVESEGENSLELFELQISPNAYLAAGTGIREITPCLGCGRRGFRRLKDQTIRLDRESLPDDDLFRLHDLPTHIIFSERFRDAALENGWTGTEFTEIEVE